MYVIGLTGPSGAGKTTALRVLEQLGGQVFDCDAIYHEMLRSDPELLERIEAAFPGSVENGVLNRKKLGARLFADPAGLQRLTDLTQPLVAKRVLEEITKSEDTSSVIRLAGDAGCHPPLEGRDFTRSPFRRTQKRDEFRSHVLPLEGKVSPQATEEVSYRIAVCFDG